MNVLEQRYRRVLRVLPDSYRQAWEEDMVATFLASMDTDDVEDAEFLADYGRPSWSEVASVARLAVRLRIGGTGVPPLSVGLGEAVRAVRLVALAVLLLSAVGATWGVWRNPWLANEIPWLPVPDEVPAFSMGFWEMAWNVVGLLWVAAFLALVFGRWWAARLFAVLAFLPGVGFAVRDTLAGNPVFARWSDVLVTALLLFTLAAFHRDTPPVRPRPWLIAFAVGVALTAHPGRDGSTCWHGPVGTPTGCAMTCAAMSPVLPAGGDRRPGDRAGATPAWLRPGGPSAPAARRRCPTVPPTPRRAVRAAYGYVPR